MFSVIKKIVKWSVIGFVGFVGFAVILAVSTDSVVPKDPAEKAAWEQRQADRAAEREAQAQAEREAQAERDRIAAAEAAEKRRKGFHCLSGWDGSHRQVTQWLKKNLKDPKSYEHIETRVLPVNAEGLHFAFVKYRAKNSFGGYVIGNVSATYKNSDCLVTNVTPIGLAPPE